MNDLFLGDELCVCRLKAPNFKTVSGANTSLPFKELALSDKVHYTYPLSYTMFI